MKTPKLFDYQKIGAAFLHQNKYALLADKQRLGKTVQAIHASDLVQIENIRSPQRVLVVCRAVAREQWQAEFKRWSKCDRPSIKIVRNQRGSLDPTALDNPGPGSVTIVSYESFNEFMRKVEGKFDIGIVDESHYLKNPGTTRTKSLLGVGEKTLINCAKRVWFLTGTPTPNHAGELWTLLYVLGRTKLDYITFVRKYCDVLDADHRLHIKGTKTDAATLEELNELLTPIMLRRTEKDVSIELPALFTSVTEVQPEPETSNAAVRLSDVFPELVKVHSSDHIRDLIEKELQLYNQIVGGYVSNTLLETLKAHSQSLSTLRRYQALQKVAPLIKIIDDELENKAYEKVVIFCLHSRAAENIKKALEKYNPAIVIGSTTDKNAEVAKFQTDPTCRVFVGNINAAGTSINLSVAHHIYFLEESWVPGENQQAIMRCGGPTQKAPTIFVRIAMLAGNSVDQKVHATLERKAKELEAIYERDPGTRELDAILE